MLIVDELQTIFAHELPITSSMGIAVEQYDGHSLILAAPLQPNINHKNTAFAGSLNALTTLTGWGLIWIVLKEAGEAGKIIIQESAIHYKRPIAGDFKAQCDKPPEITTKRFLHTLERHHKARIALDVSIMQDKHVAVQFHGRYVAYHEGAIPEMDDSDRT
jgi:thioesterase domain-containing protein